MGGKSGQQQPSRLSRIRNKFGFGVILTRINLQYPRDEGDQVVEKFLIFFQNWEDWRPKLFNPAKPETYPESTFKDAITLDSALITLGMGYSEIQ
ncbi:hypothetical protein LCGC14_1043370 [marine sediment metagenome]|uniref:Uncharacterized protein n=2 Tax=root TaxID=1 RepID=A0A831QQE4_9FLAO|nr:hypothetical protein [Pricia antarctica]